MGDRLGLFSAVANAIDATTVLYPGSYVDITPSFIWPSTTYVDVDRRANQLFSDSDGVLELLAERGVPGGSSVQFIHADYTTDLDLVEESFDLLISLYAGFISEHCTEQLRIGGHLLVNPSHGDADMASLDTRYRLLGVVDDSSGDYEVDTSELDAYFVPKRNIEVTIDLLHETGRGVNHTASPFAYLFERVA